MSIDIRARIRKKATTPKTALAMEDVNRDLIVSLFAVDIYGVEARDEEIHNIIIGGGYVRIDAAKQMRKDYEAIKSTLKRGKDGMMRNPDGYIVLEPC